MSARHPNLQLEYVEPRSIAEGRGCGDCRMSTGVGDTQGGRTGHGPPPGKPPSHGLRGLSGTVWGVTCVMGKLHYRSVHDTCSLARVTVVVVVVVVLLFVYLFLLLSTTSHLLLSSYHRHHHHHDHYIRCRLYSC